MTEAFHLVSLSFPSCKPCAAPTHSCVLEVTAAFCIPPMDATQRAQGGDAGCAPSTHAKTPRRNGCTFLLLLLGASPSWAPNPDPTTTMGMGEGSSTLYPTPEPKFLLLHPPLSRAALMRRFPFLNYSVFLPPPHPRGHILPHIPHSIPLKCHCCSQDNAS